MFLFYGNEFALTIKTHKSNTQTMKKLLLLILCTTTLGLVSCKKDTIIDSGLPNLTIEDYINPEDWVESENGTRLSATLNFPEITRETFIHDGIVAYLYLPGSETEYRALPYVFDAQSYTYIVRQGQITFEIQTSDEQILVPIKPTISRKLRVVIVTSSK